MSTADKDLELKDLLLQLLEKNGSLAKIRASTRASVFLELSKDIKKDNTQASQNDQVQSFLKTVDGQTLFFLVKEFLEFFNLHFTLEVFETESCLNTLPKYDKTLLEKQVNFTKGLYMTDKEVPLLHKILLAAQASKVSELTNSDNIDKPVEYTDDFTSGNSSISSKCSELTGDTKSS